MRASPRGGAATRPPRAGRAVVLAKGANVHVFHEGSYFGEVGCVHGAVRTASVKAIMFCELQILPKAALLGLLDDFPEARDELKVVGDERLTARPPPPQKGPLLQQRRSGTSPGGERKRTDVAARKQSATDVTADVQAALKKQLDDSMADILDVIKDVVAGELRARDAAKAG